MNRDPSGVQILSWRRRMNKLCEEKCAKLAEFEAKSQFCIRDCIAQFIFFYQLKRHAPMKVLIN